MKAKLIFIGIILLLVVVIVWSFSALHSSRKDNDRLSANQVSLMSGCTKYKTTSGMWASKVTVLNLKNSEFKKSNDSLMKIINELGIKNRRLLEVTNTAAATNINFNLPAKDSIIYVDGHVDTLKCMKYHDLWTDFNGCMFKNNFSGSICNRDTLYHVLHKIPKRFLFFRFGCKAVQMDVISSNPHTQITYTKIIRLSN